MKKLFSLFAAVLFAGSIMADDPVVLFHESFGDNSSSARAWNDSYSVKTGVAAVYQNIESYGLTNAKQGKNTTGHVNSGLNQSSSDADAILIVGPLNVANYKELAVSYYWKAASIKATYTTKLYYATASDGTYTEVSGTGTGATTFVKREYTLPAAAQVSTLYLKVVWNTSNTQAIIDELELTGVANAEVPVVDATAIELNKSELSLQEGENETLVATLTPENATTAVTWETTDESVAKVANGKVTAVAPGTATITASAGEGISATCAVTVTAAPRATCADVYEMSKNDVAKLNPVTVTYVNGKNAYVKDATGSMLLYLPANATWNAGDVLTDVEGTVDIYNDLYEVKLTAGQVTAVEAVAGEAPAPVVLNAAPVAADMNKYVIIKGVSVAEGEFTTSDITNLDATLEGATFVLRNNYKIAQEFVEDKIYDIVGICAVYTKNSTTTIQLYPISIEEHIEPADRRINAYGLNSVANGDDYNFTFYSNIAGNEASLLFYNNGTLVGRVKLDDAPVAGINEVTLSKADIPQGTGLTWAVELKANRVETFNKVFDDTKHVLNRFHVNIDNSPESDYFGRVYGENRVSDGLGHVYVFNQNYSLRDSAILAGQTKWQSAGRPWVDEDGTVLLADYGDNHGGVYIMNPSTLTATSFFDGTQASSGLWKNGTVELGSSCVAVAVYGSGENKVLIAANEDAGTQLTKNGLTLYNIGQADGSVLRTWNTAPSKVMPLQNNGGGNFAFAPCSHGIFVAQNRSIPASGTNNNSTAYSVMMYDYQGNKLFVSDNDHMPNLTASPGGGIALSADESKFAIIDQSSNIRLYNVTWNENTPSMTLAATYPCGYAAAGTLSFDYAGNLIGSMGTGYGTSMRLVVYGVPTDNNTIVVPAKKSLTVIGTDPNPTTAIDNSFVPVKVEKIFRNGQVLIIKDGKTYNMMGQIVE